MKINDKTVAIIYFLLLVLVLISSILKYFSFGESLIATMLVMIWGAVESKE